MRKSHLGLISLALLAVLFCLAGSALAADTWKPKRPVEIVAPAGPGGGWDRLARIIQRVAKENDLLNKPVVVVNKPGGGGATGWTYLKTKDGRGEFMAVTSSLILLNNILGKSDLMYSDFTPLATMQTEWECIVVAADAPWKNLDEFFAALKEDPKSVPIGIGPSLGNDDHVQLLMLADKAGVDPASLKFVVYPGCASEMLPALMGGHVKALTVSYGEILEQAKAGNVRYLGVSAPERVKPTPDVPTYREQGYDVVFGHWRGVVGAPNMTEAQKAFWGDFLKKVTESEVYIKAMEAEGLEPYYQSPDEHAAFLAEQYEINKKLLKQVGLAQ